MTNTFVIPLTLRIFILQLHPIVQQSFAIIDQEIGDHTFPPDEYAVVKRVIHSTADFEFVQLIQFSASAIAHTVHALQQGVPIVTDVGMVALGIRSMVQNTFQNSVISAVSLVKTPAPGCTLTETGILQCWEEYPQAIYVIGNAPTALLALCRQLQSAQFQSAQFQSAQFQSAQFQEAQFQGQHQELADVLRNAESSMVKPPVIIGAPVGFVSVLESKQMLAQTDVEQIRVEGRKGGSAVAAGIMNALLYLAWEKQQSLDS